MSKFRKDNSRSKVTISTASLPDIVFMMLFFFMVSATIRDERPVVKTKIPQAKELTKIDKKILIRELKVGVPVNKGVGEEFKIVFKDKFLTLDQLSQWAQGQRDEMPEYYRNQMIIVLKADEEVNMGVISDIQQELRKINVRKILYRTLKE